MRNMHPPLRDAIYFSHLTERIKVFDTRPTRRFSERRRSIQGREFPRTPIFETRNTSQDIVLIFACPWGNLPRTGLLNRDHFMAGHKTGSRQL